MENGNCEFSYDWQLCEAASNSWFIVLLLKIKKEMKSGTVIEIINFKKNFFKKGTLYPSVYPCLMFVQPIRMQKSLVKRVSSAPWSHGDASRTNQTKIVLMINRTTKESWSLNENLSFSEWWRWSAMVQRLTEWVLGQWRTIDAKMIRLKRFVKKRAEKESKATKIQTNTHSLLFASRLLRRSSSTVIPFEFSQSCFSCSNARLRSSSSRIWISRACK